jgi:hypothetical protein
MSGVLGSGLRRVSLSNILSDEIEKRSVWAKGSPIPGFDPAIWRLDRFGSPMKFSEYGQQTGFGWEKDHPWLSALDGSQAPANIKPMHWQNNRAKGTRIL